MLTPGDIGNDAAADFISSLADTTTSESRGLWKSIFPVELSW
jgi:hypothetical protein